MADEKFKTTQYGGGPRLLPALILCWLLGAAGLAAWWFVGYLSSELNQAQSRQQSQLRAVNQLLESRLNSAELISDLLSATARSASSSPSPARILAQDAAPLAESGLLAVGWWPANSRQPVDYYVLRAGQWSKSTQAGSIERLPRQASWYALAPTQGAKHCLWSTVETELDTGQEVLSCTRAVFNLNGVWQGTLRLSFKAEELFRDMPLVDGVVVSNARGEVLHGLAHSKALASRNLAQMSQQQQGWGPLLTHVYLEDERSLEQHALDIPQSKELIQDLLKRGIDGSEVRAQQRLSAHAIDPSALPSHAKCTDAWCLVSQPLRRLPWRTSLIYPIPSTAPVSFDPRLHKPLWAGLLALSLTLLAFGLIASLRMSRPLKRLGNQLDRHTPLPDFDENQPGHWGRIAAALNQLVESNRELRMRSLQPAKVSAKDLRAEDSWLYQLPLAALLISRDGLIRQLNAAAQALLDARPGQPANTVSLRLADNAGPVSLDELPDNCREHVCELVTHGKSASLRLSTAKVHGESETLVVLQAAAKTTTQAAAIPDPPQSAREHMRAFLARLTAPTTWAFLQAKPAEGTLTAADASVYANFYEQVEGRISERLEDQEYLLNLGAGHYLVYAQKSLDSQRKNLLAQGLESALVFCAGQRVRLSLDSYCIGMEPGHREEDLDAAIFQLLNPQASEHRLRSHSAAEWDKLIETGFNQRRFQLITEHARKLRGEAAQGGVFRVIPHLEDEEGFWLDAADFMPVVERLKRRAELDIWLLEEVSKALARITDTPPAEVVLPLSAKSLLENDNAVAEQLLQLTQSPRPNPLQVVISIHYDDLKALNSDPQRLQQMVRSLGCELLLDRVGLDLESLRAIERIKPHTISVSATLMQQSLESQAAAIGMEAIFRTAESLSARSLLLGVDSQAMQQQAEKLGADLAFGSAIGRPSPILFKAVA